MFDLNMDDIRYIVKTAGVVLGAEIIFCFLATNILDDVLLSQFANYLINHLLPLLLVDFVISYTSFKLKFKSGHYVSSPTYLNTVKWNSLNIALYIESNNPFYLELIKESMKDWNNTGVTNFYLVNDRKKANVIIQTKDHLDRNIAETIVGNAKDKVIYKQMILRINMMYINQNTDMYSNKLAIEHELGHVLGLGHRQGYTVMDIRKNERNCLVTPEDANAIKQHYSFN